MLNLLTKQLNTHFQREPLTGAIIGAAAIAGATGGQMYANSKMNKKAIAYNREAYVRQRADALADWDMQNKYNSPAEQMKRFREAGLNPNLIYGQQNEGATVRSSDMQGMNWQQSDIMPAGKAIGDAFSSYITRRAADQALKNAQAQEQLTKTDIAQKAAQTANILQQTTAGEFSLSQQKRLSDTAFASAEQALKNSQITGDNLVKQGQNTVALTDKIRTETGLSVKDYELREAMNKKTVALAGEQILKTAAETANTKAQKDAILQAIENAKKDGTLKDYEIELNKIGSQKSDSMIMRLINAIMQKAFGGNNSSRLINPKNP